MIHLPALFYQPPQIACTVQPVPAHDEKTSVGAFYVSCSLAEKRPGTFYINTYNLKALPVWELDALTLHEAIPGHHLQICRAQEVKLPLFQQHSFSYCYTAFVEGWGLYAETLGKELGLYTDPYARFGMLTYQMLRAVRLVVDTGMHALGWSRQQAIDYFMRFTGKDFHEAETEIDRYLVLPGQALAYKIGQLKILELRAYAQEKLGAQFDIREFHDMVLSQGSILLPILEIRVKEWVDAKLIQPVALEAPQSISSASCKS